MKDFLNWIGISLLIFSFFMGFGGCIHLIKMQ